MIPCVVFDLPTLGAFAMAAVVIVVVYLIYRDIRMIMQMITDLREEFMMLQVQGDGQSVEEGHAPEAFNFHEDEHEDEDEEGSEEQDMTEATELLESDNPAPSMHSSATRLQTQVMEINDDATLELTQQHASHELDH